MAKLLVFVLLFLVVLYGVSPYYSIYRLDQALSEEDAAAIAPFVDLAAIQAQYKARLSDGVDQALTSQDQAAAPILDWISANLQQISGQALEQIVSVEFVRSILRKAAIDATETRPAYLIAGIDYAFFTSWNRFEIRLDETQVIMRLDGIDWRITDIRQGLR